MDCVVGVGFYETFAIRWTIAMGMGFYITSAIRCMSYTIAGDVRTDSYHSSPRPEPRDSPRCRHTSTGQPDRWYCCRLAGKASLRTYTLLGKNHQCQLHITCIF